MGHRLTAAVASLLAVACCSRSAHAWGGEGHQVVALIAYARLTPDAKAATKAILGDGKDIYDGEVASWADQVRRTKGYTQTASWHYVDIVVGSSGYDEKRDGHKGQNVCAQIDAQAAILADKSKPAADRAEALKWVVHLVGDVEQPLHCAERNDDRGGNKQAARMPGSKAKNPSNLHTIWDTTILRSMIGRSDITDFADGLNSKIADKDSKAWASGSRIDWANESFAVAGKYVYAGVKEGEEVELQQTYVDAAKPIIEQQLQRGGVRLAMVLNKALGTAAKK